MSGSTLPPTIELCSRIRDGLPCLGRIHRSGVPEIACCTACGKRDRGALYRREGSSRPRACVVGVILDAEGRLLLGRRLVRDTGFGLWVMPGGGIEGTETFEEALRREVREECRVEISVGPLALVYRHIEGPTNNVAVFFHATIKSGEPVGGDDLGDPAFFTLTEVACLDLTPATRIVLDTIHRELAP